MIFFDTKIRVQYHETDQMGIVHHSNYLKYFEFARIEMLREMGIVYKKIEEMGILIPVHSLSVKYMKPIFYDQELKIKVKFNEQVGYKIKFEYELYNDQEQLCCKSEVVVFFLDKETKKIIKAPEFCLKAIEKYIN